MQHFPRTRMRRCRRHAVLRDWQAETHLRPSAWVQPLFLTEGPSSPIPSLPGQQRWGPDDLMPHLDHMQQLGIQGVALFPVVPQAHKTQDASHAWSPTGLLPQAIRSIKRTYPDLMIIADVALDPYTPHGQDGLLDPQHRTILNDATCDALVQQALCLAEAGTDVLAPSDMMDGRIGRIRDALEDAGYTDTLLLSYTAKYASCLYGPFRHAVGSAEALGQADKATYQMHPANIEEALREADLDHAEGADMLMVKPAMLYLDVLHKLRQHTRQPLWAYQVSGEYAMLWHAAQHGALDWRTAVLESLLCIHRAGGSVIITYAASQAAAWLQA